MSIPTFPPLPGLAYPVKRSPLFKTVTQEAVSGKDYRLSFWTYPRYKFEVMHDVLRSGASFEEWQAFEGFFKQCAGAALPFHWFDVNDNAISGQQIAIGDGVTKQFNFTRSLGNYVEPIQDVTASSVLIFVNGAQVTTGWSLVTDPEWGLVYAVTFATAPAAEAAISASFGFNWPCRFDADQADLSNFMSGYFSLDKISFTTVKVM